MTEVELTFAAQVLAFLEAAGVGFGDIVILLTLCGFFWLVSKGKIKIGGNGYVTESEFRSTHEAVRNRMDRTCKVVEALREDVGELSEKIATIDGQLRGK